MINTESQKTKYGIDFTKGFKKKFKKVIKQGKDIKSFPMLQKSQQIRKIQNQNLKITHLLIAKNILNVENVTSNPTGYQFIDTKMIN